MLRETENARTIDAAPTKIVRGTVAIAAAASFALLCALVGCAPETFGGDGAEAGPVSETPTESATDEAEVAAPEPRTQEETCDWGASALSASADAPTGQTGDLQTVIIGSWQHTHFDTGAGYEPNSTADIRYVFPSTSHLLYCQDVPGITDQAQNAADFTWEGNKIVLPGIPGYTVSEWNDNSMVWINHMDDSRYLLQRR